jgi:hypothetical protein
VGDGLGPTASPTRGRGRAAVCAAGLAAAIVLFVALAYGLGEDNDVFRSYDYREIFRYQKEYYRSALLDGRLPLWTPHTFCGWPFAANPITQTFYPPALLALVLPLPEAAVADLVFHLVLAAVGTWLLLRCTYGLARGPAAFGGLAYACTGTAVAHAYAGHVPYYAAAAYIPWVLLAADRAVGSGGGSRLDVRWLCAGAAALGLQILSGGVPFVWLTVLLLLYRAGDLLCRPSRRAHWWREIVALGLIVLGAAGLAAVQLLPSAELARLSNRIEAGWEYAAQISLPPELLLNLVLANGSAHGHEPFWEYYGYAGVVPSFFAAVAVWRARAERRVLVLLAVAVVAALFAVGDNAFLFPLLWKYVPGFGLFRAPARALVVVALVIAVLAAIGLDAAAGLVARRSRAAAHLLVVLAFALAFVDLVVAARANRERLWIAESSAAPDGVHPQLAALLEGDRSWYRFWFPRTYFRENHAYALDARSIGGYDNLQLARYGRFVHRMTDTPYPRSLITMLDPRMFVNASGPFPFKILGVKYSWGRDARLHGRAEPVRRAWFVTRACRVADEEAALARMHDRGFEAEHEVVFEAPEADRLGIDGASCVGEAGPAANVDVEELSPEHLRIELGPHPRGFVVLSEIDYPGWRAIIAGRSVPIHRADSILRAVAVGEGDAEIEMTFAPPSLCWGATISLATVLVLVVGLWRSGAREPSSGPAEQVARDL